MSAETIKEFLVGLGFKVDQASMNRFAAGIAGATAKAAALGAAVTAAAGAIVVGVKKIAEGYDELDRLGETFRTTAAEIDAFIDTAQILGVSNEKAKDSLKALDAAIVDTSMGMGRAAKVFEELGIEVTTADGKLKSTTAVMGELVTELDNVERGKRVRILERLGLDPATMRVFGKDFAGFNADLQQLQQDLADIDKAVGFDFDSAVASSKEFMLSWRALGREVEKWKYLFSKAMTSVAMKLLPQFREQMKGITESLNTFRKRTMEYMPRIIESIMPVVRAIMRVAEAFLRIAYRIGRAAMTIINWLLRLNKATGGWLLWVGLAAAAWMKLNLAFLATPLGMLLAAGVAIAALVDDFLTWKEGGESLIDWSGTLGEAMQLLIDIIAALGEAFITGIGAAREWLAGFFEWCADAWKQMGDDARATVDAIAEAGQALIDAWQSVKDWFSGLFDFFGSGFEKLKNVAQDIGGKIKGFFGGGNNTPSPSTRAALAGYGAQVSQTTTINVNGAGNPQATAAAVAGKQTQVARATRNLMGATR